MHICLSLQQWWKKHTTLPNTLKTSRIIFSPLHMTLLISKHHRQNLFYALPPPLVLCIVDNHNNENKNNNNNMMTLVEKCTQPTPLHTHTYTCTSLALLYSCWSFYPRCTVLPSWNNSLIILHKGPSLYFYLFFYIQYIKKNSHIICSFFWFYFIKVGSKWKELDGKKKSYVQWQGRTHLAGWRVWMMEQQELWMWI